eukprot:6029607-Ditylum_brightwellii.AAC.1
MIKAIAFQCASDRPTPAEAGELPADVDGLGSQESWSYASVISMLMYLAAKSWPDIAMAVKRIAHYLIKTKDTCPGQKG